MTFSISYVLTCRTYVGIAALAAVVPCVTHVVFSPSLADPPDQYRTGGLVISSRGG